MFYFYGGSIGFLLGFHEMSMIVLWGFHGGSLWFLRVWDFYWIPVWVPWYFCRISIGISTGISLGFQGPGCLWGFYGLNYWFTMFFNRLVGFLWHSYEIFLIFLCYFYGVSIGLSMGIIWDSYGVSLWLQCDFFMLFLWDFGGDLHEISMGLLCVSIESKLRWIETSIGIRWNRLKVIKLWNPGKVN